ncbi:MAG: hypothetical protein WCO93_04115 [bacterium]
MNKDIIKGELQALLEAINEQFEILRGYDEKIPRIEYDIIRDNVRKFYEDLHRLRKLYDHAEPQPEAKRILPVPETVVKAPQPEPEKPKKTAEPEILKEVTPKPASRKPAKPPDVDLFAGEEPTFSIKLREARDKSLGPKVSPEKSRELKSSIGINEKFMFINELFDGNLREYNDAIEVLGGFETLNDASEYLDLLKKRHFWDTGSRAFKKLSEIVTKRY